MPKSERLSQGFSVFNLHSNHAGQRANAEYIAQFGKPSWDQFIAPHWRTGIMAIFEAKPTPETQAWVALVTAYVNEDRGDKAVEIAEVERSETELREERERQRKERVADALRRAHPDAALVATGDVEDGAAAVADNLPGTIVRLKKVRDDIEYLTTLLSRIETEDA